MKKTLLLGITTACLFLVGTTSQTLSAVSFPNFNNEELSSFSAENPDLLLENIIKYSSTEDFFVCTQPYQDINGLVVMEAENLTVPSGWAKQSSFSGYTGSGYISWTGPEYFSTVGNGLISTKIFINSPGIYRFQMRSRVGFGTSGTEHNDTWVRFPDASDYYALSGSSKIYPKGSGKSPNPNGAGANGWFKIYMNSLNWTWNTLTSDNDPHDIYVQFNASGVYTMELSARSAFHLIDRLVLHKNASNPLSLTNPETKCSDQVTNVPVTSIALSPTSASIQTGSTRQLSATVSPTNAINKTVLWSTSNANVATVNSNGLVSGVAVGTATVTARTQDGNFSATSSITVTQNTSTLSISSFVLINAGNDTEIQTLVNGTQLLSSQVGSLSLNVKVNTNPNTVGSIFISLSGPVNTTRTENGAPYALFGDNNGNYSGRTLPNGNYTLSAIPYSGTNRSGTVGQTTTIQFSIVTSTSIAVTGIAVNPTSASVQTGSTLQLNPSVSPSNATNKSVVWTSSNTNVASVNTSGLVTGLATGNATISARTVDGNFTSGSLISVTGFNSNEGLAGHWKMDEGSGNRLLDSSGNGNDATFVSSSSGVTWVQGQNNLALRTNGALNRYATVSHNPSLDISQEITVSAWIRPNTVGRRQILSKGGPDGFELGIFESGKIEFRINRESNGTAYRLFSVADYPSDGNTWMHVAVTFDGTASRIYINGVLDNSITFAPATIKSNTTELQIGARQGSNRWSGDIDDLRLYSRALSASEVLNLTNAGGAFRTIENPVIKGGTANSPENHPSVLEKDAQVRDRPGVTRMFPNPVLDLFNLELSNLQEDRVQVSIFDMKGILLLDQEFESENGTLVLDISKLRLKPGTHVLLVNTNGSQQVFKFLKK